MNTKLIGSFLGGFLLGGIAGYFAANQVLKKKFDKKYDEFSEYLAERYEKSSLYEAKMAPESKKEGDSEDLEGLDRELGPLSREERLKNHERLRQNAKNRTNYRDYYKKKEEDPAEKEHPEDDEPEENSTADEDFAEKAFEDHQKNRKRPPRILSVDALGELGPEWEQQTLMYYLYDGVLTTEEEDILEDPARLLGDCLEKYGFNENDEMVIYVQNFEFTTVYEVQKVHGAFL